jgi:hypothetical protein
LRWEPHHEFLCFGPEGSGFHGGRYRRRAVAVGICRQRPVALSNGTTENIRCKADYKVAAGGMGLKQALHCASDSYKFDLTSDVTSQGDRISGNWSEKSRNIFGNLQGTAGGGQISVFVEASGFAATLNLRTNGSKQVVQIESKGEIRGVNITMTKG